MHFRTGKTNRFSVSQVENGNNSVNVMVLCVFQCRNTSNLGLKTNFFYDLCTFSMKL